MVLELRKFGNFIVANGASVAVFLLSVLLHGNVSVALEVAHLTLELYNAGVDSLMGHDPHFTDEDLLAEVARVGLSEDVRHLLMLSKLAWSEELHVAERATESGIGSSMEFFPMVEKAVVRAEVPDHRALETNVREFTVVLSECLFTLHTFEALQTLLKLDHLFMLLHEVLFQRHLVSETLVAEWALWGDLLLIGSFQLLNATIIVEPRHDPSVVFTREWNVIRILRWLGDLILRWDESSSLKLLNPIGFDLLESLELHFLLLLSNVFLVESWMLVSEVPLIDILLYEAVFTLFTAHHLLADELPNDSDIGRCVRSRMDVDSLLVIRQCQGLLHLSDPAYRELGWIPLPETKLVEDDPLFLGWADLSSNLFHCLSHPIEFGSRLHWLFSFFAFILCGVEAEGGGEEIKTDSLSIIVLVLVLLIINFLF